MACSMQRASCNVVEEFCRAGESARALIERLHEPIDAATAPSAAERRSGVLSLDTHHTLPSDL